MDVLYVHPKGKAMDGLSHSPFSGGEGYMYIMSEKYASV